MAFCPGCGSQVADGAAVCPSCGRALAGAPAAAQAPAAGGMADNVAALLSYLVITAIIFLLMDPYNKRKFVRFHSVQAIGLCLVSIAGHLVLGLIPIVGWLLMPFWALAIFIVAVVCAIKAYQNQWFKLPVLGDFSEKQANAV